MNTLLLLSFLAIIGVAFGGISDKCLACICKLEGCESQVNKCKDDKGSPSCGPYQIKKPYWTEGGRHGGDYEACTKQLQCSKETVRGYMNRYAKNCRAGEEKCEDYLRIHNGGPTGCKVGSDQHRATDAYWTRAQKECARF